MPLLVLTCALAHNPKKAKMPVKRLAKRNFMVDWNFKLSQF